MGVPSRIVARAEGNQTGSAGVISIHSAFVASQSSFEQGISHLNSLRFASPTDSSENIRYADVWIIIQKQALHVNQGVFRGGYRLKVSIWTHVSHVPDSTNDKSPSRTT